MIYYLEILKIDLLGDEMNRIVTEKCKTLRALARQALSGHWGEALALMLVCQIILSVPSILVDILPAALQTETIQLILNIYIIVINAPVTLSISRFFIRLFRQQPRSGLQEIRFGFDNIAKALILYMRMLVFTFLWSLLLFIPGIIAALNYSQAFYLLADNPNKSAAQCMAESKFIMHGNKWKYVKLMLSFIGWELLVEAPSVAAYTIFCKDYIIEAQRYISLGNFDMAIAYMSMSHPVVSLLQLLTVLCAVYVNAAGVAFFDILTGKLVVKKVDSIITAAPAESVNADGAAADMSAVSAAEIENTASFDEPAEGESSAETDSGSENDDELH